MDDLNSQGHYKKIRQVLILILTLNWGAALAKIIYGYLSRCTSMTADGFHSLSDGASNIIGLIGIGLACQPKDKDHPYGHKKYETFFALGIAAVLFILCFELLEQGVRRFLNPVTPNIDARSFVVMLVTLAVNILVMRYEYRTGERLKSDILVSDALHTKTDILTSLSVIATLVAIKLGAAFLDPIVTMIIAVFIAREAFEISQQSSRVLCDKAAIVDEKMISDIVLGVAGVKTCHKIRSRGRPDDIYIDLHVQVNPGMHVSRAHEISYAIEEAIKKSIPEVTDVVVHIEPEEKN